MSQLVRQQQGALTPETVFRAFPSQYQDAQMRQIVYSFAHNQAELMRLLQVAADAYATLRPDVDDLQTRMTALERREPQLPSIPRQLDQQPQQWQQPGLYIGGDVHYHVDNSRHVHTRTTRNRGGEGFWQAIAILYCGLALLVVIANSATTRATYQLDRPQQTIENSSH